MPGLIGAIGEVGFRFHRGGGEGGSQGGEGDAEKEPEGATFPLPPACGEEGWDGGADSRASIFFKVSAERHCPPPDPPHRERGEGRAQPGTFGTWQAAER
jgi:hypothetical protein